jgi:oligosaccharyltransferase complex subunit gamma
MKLLSLASAVFFASAALAAKKSAGSSFEAYHTRALSSTPIVLDDASYERMTAAPRDYSVAVLLTALEDRFGCKLCRDFQPEWNIIANSWLRGDKKGERKTLFASLDFGNGRATFMKVWLIK